MKRIAIFNMFLGLANLGIAILNGPSVLATINFTVGLFCLFDGITTYRR